jgi:hypothetical protein
MLQIANHRRTAIDHLMLDVEHEYRSGRIGITDTGEIISLRDISEQMPMESRLADYHIASARDIDRDHHRHCRHCQTAYRASEQRDPSRCPFCWRLI